MKERILALADCNNFFVSCEILKNPTLKGKPVCVLSNCDGCVVSRSTEAKAIGIPMGMPLFMAKKEFPNAIYLSGDLKTYHEVSKRVQKVFKVCKKYLSHFQKSVFRGEMNPSKLIRFKTDLNKVIDKNEDFICIIKLMNGNVFGEEVLGSKGNNTGEDLII